VLGARPWVLQASGSALEHSPVPSGTHPHPLACRAPRKQPPGAPGAPSGNPHVSPHWGLRAPADPPERGRGGPGRSHCMPSVRALPQPWARTQSLSTERKQRGTRYRKGTRGRGGGRGRGGRRGRGEGGGGGGGGGCAGDPVMGWAPPAPGRKLPGPPPHSSTLFLLLVSSKGASCRCLEVLLCVGALRITGECGAVLVSMEFVVDCWVMLIVPVTGAR